ncbi:MFS transporter [bacterium]|nr:MAG: MFS transporter [bacterium]
MPGKVPNTFDYQHPQENSTIGSERSFLNTTLEYVPSNPKPIRARRIPLWAPLRSRTFRALWIASLISNFGTWMHGVGAAWLMTELSSDTRLNALVSACESLPMFLLALPAGALADIFDRRKMLAIMQTCAFLTTGLLAALTFGNQTGAGVLLMFTALLAVCSALASPAWQSITPEIVKRSHYSAAVGLGGISWNLARVLGPTLGGVIIGKLAPIIGNLSAPAAVFALNAVSFLAVVAVVLSWKRSPRLATLPPEHVLGAMRAGLSYVRYTPTMRAVLVRVLGFILFSSAFWALLSIHARKDLGLSATEYGTMLGFFGAGAITVGASIERLRARFSPDALVTISSLGTALGLVLLATVHDLWLTRLVMLVNGFAWPLAMLSFQVAVVKSVPDWVRSRAASLFLLTFSGGSALGSIIWGMVARQTSIPTAMYCGAAGLVTSVLVLRKFRVEETTRATQEPSNHWPEPIFEIAVEPSRGPVLVTTEFFIAPENARAFVEAMKPIRMLRLREGALRWNLYQDAATPRRWVETMLLDSWNDHLRQHARVSVEGAELEAHAWKYHEGHESPFVSHLIAERALLWEDEEAMLDDDEDEDDENVEPTGRFARWGWGT